MDANEERWESSLGKLGLARDSIFLWERGAKFREANNEKKSKTTKGN